MVNSSVGSRERLPIVYIIMMVIYISRNRDNTMQKKLALSIAFLTMLFFSTLATAAELVNINKASAAAIQQNLVGIGPIKAEAIVKYRSKNGKYKSLDDLQGVTGIGPALIKKNKRYLSLSKGVVSGDDKAYAAAKKQAGKSKSTGTKKKTTKAKKTTTAKKKSSTKTTSKAKKDSKKKTSEKTTSKTKKESKKKSTSKSKTKAKDSKKKKKKKKTSKSTT